MFSEWSYRDIGAEYQQGAMLYQEKSYRVPGAVGPAIPCQVCGKQNGLFVVGRCPDGGLHLGCIHCREYRNYYENQLPPGIHPGQRIARPKIGFPLGTHSGVALHNGVVFHNDPEHGAHFSDFASFAQRRPVWPTSPPVSQGEYEKILLNAQALAGKPYELMYNCEDTANEVRYGIPSSPTRGWVGVAATCLVLWLVSKS
jgi:hypothetical protein